MDADIHILPCVPKQRAHAQPLHVFGTNCLAFVQHEINRMVCAGTCVTAVMVGGAASSVHKQTPSYWCTKMTQSTKAEEIIILGC